MIQGKEKGTRIWRFENSQPSRIAKYNKASEKNGVAEQPLDYKLMGLYEQKHCHFGLTELKMVQNEERWLDLLDLTGWDDGAMWL